MKKSYAPPKQQTSLKKSNPLSPVLSNSNVILTIILGIMCIVLISCGIILYNLQSNIHINPTVNAEADFTNYAQIPYITELIATYTGPKLVENDTINLTNITIQAMYNNGTVKEIPNTDILWPSTINMPLSAGENHFKIDYCDVTTDMILYIETKSVMTKASDFEEEYANAQYAYSSHNLWVTGTKAHDKDVYWIFHILTSPDNIPRITVNDNAFPSTGGILHNAETYGWKIACNASYVDEQRVLPEGLYINNRELFAGETTSGNELCITEDGELFTPEAGLTFDDLMLHNVIYTSLSENPLLIANGEKLDIENDTTKTKTIIGMVEPGEYYIISSTDGYYNNYNTFASLRDILYDKGCVYAKALSGHKNTTIAADGQVLVKTPCQNTKLLDALAFFE